MLVKFFWFLDNSYGKTLQRKVEFIRWLIRFFECWEYFLVKKKDSFILKNYKLNDSFELKEGFVLPSDGKLENFGEIQENQLVGTDQISYNILEILEAIVYKEFFTDGMFAHLSLSFKDCQKFYMPINGTLLDEQVIPSLVSFGIKKTLQEKIVAVKGKRCKFVQDRALLIFHNDEFGMFALIPIGLVHASSIDLKVKIGEYVSKGQELGSFRCGASDFFILFQSNRIKLTSKLKRHYKCGNEMCVFS